MKPDQIPMLTDYLLKNLAGEGRSRQKSCRVPPWLNSTEWELPTKGSRRTIRGPRPDARSGIRDCMRTSLGTLTQNRSDQGISAQDAAFRPHGLVGDKEGKYLVHRKYEELHREPIRRPANITGTSAGRRARSHTTIFDQKGTLSSPCRAPI